MRSSYLEPIKFVQTRIHSKYTSFAISHLQSALDKKSPSEHKDNLQGPLRRCVIRCAKDYRISSVIRRTMFLLPKLPQIRISLPRCERSIVLYDGFTFLAQRRSEGDKESDDWKYKESDVHPSFLTVFTSVLSLQFFYVS